MLTNRNGRNRAIIALVFACVCGANSLLGAQQQPPPAGVPQPRSAAEDMMKGRADGDSAAAKVETGAWVRRGFFSPFGAAGVTNIEVLVNTSDVSLSLELSLRIVNESTVYQQAYRESYAERLKARRMAATFKGAVLGKVAAIVLIAVVGSVYFAPNPDR